MFRGNSIISKHPPSHKLKTSLKGLGLIFILLLTLVGFTLGQLPEQSDLNDLCTVESHPATPPTPCLAMGASFYSFQCGMFALIRVLQLLQSHIGEKRFSNIIIQFNNVVVMQYSHDGSLWGRLFAFCFDKVNRS